METPNEKEKISLHRSPRYPNFGLGKAIEKVEKFYTHNKKNSVSVGSALISMGYGVKITGRGLQALAALGYYGLVDTIGKADSKRVKITERAYRIVFDKNPDSAERQKALREAALSPAYFRILYNEYPESLPSDAALRDDLLFKHEFNENSVKDFIRVFKETLELAKIYESGNIEENLGDTGDEMGDMDDSFTPPPPPKNTERERQNMQQGNPAMKGTPLSFTLPGFSFQLIPTGNTTITQKVIGDIETLLKTFKSFYPQDDEPITKDESNES